MLGGLPSGASLDFCRALALWGPAFQEGSLALLSMGDFQVGLFGFFLSLHLGSGSGRQHLSRCTACADQLLSPDVVGSVFFPSVGGTYDMP